MASENNINKATAKKELSLLLPKIDSIFESEPAVFRTDAEPMMIVGDIHGYLQALNSIIKKRNEIGCKNILFLGDYVDRGIQGTEVLLRLFQLKIEHPGHIFLLRGNHEDAEMNFQDGFFEEIGFDKEFLLKINRTYTKMPVAAVLSGHTFCVHGELTEWGALILLKRKNLSPIYGMTPQNAQASHLHLEVRYKEIRARHCRCFLTTNNLKIS